VASSDGVTGLQPRLAGVAGFLDRFLLPLVLIIAGLGVALPEPGRRLDGGGAILITLAVLVFCTGSSVTFADFRGLRAASRRMVLVLAATTVILPALAWLASRLVSEAALQGGVLAPAGWDGCSHTGGRGGSAPPSSCPPRRGTSRWRPASPPARWASPPRAPLGIYGVMVLVFGAITVYVSKRA
jgi:hypothetical protein